MAVSNVSLLRLVDYCDRLHRLNHANRDEEAVEEFHEICRKIFGFTIDDIPNVEFEKLDSELCLQAESIKSARELGYDLTINGLLPVMDWEDFWLMIRAKRANIVPDSASERAAIRLQNDAEYFLSERKSE